MSTRYKIMFLGVIIISFLTVFCSRGYRYESTKDMTLNAKDFISKVRYIITKDEKNRFYSLTTDQERKDFIENFWKQRDPDPATEENEFRDEYYKRIDEANHLFRGDSGKGWLSDRGRIYILLGPPDYRRFNPGEINSWGNMKAGYQYPHEIWYYGFYPIIFIDQLENGNFVLSPLSSEHLATILSATMSLKPKVAKGEKIPFNFNAQVIFEEKGQVILKVKIPYKNILFQADPENKGRFIANLTLHTAIFGAQNKKIQEFSNNYPLSMTEEELKAQENYAIEVPLTLAPGKYEAQLTLESKADDIRIKKNAKFKI
ncbi:MAG TPA: GWxTD domain-containing protein [Candidatus Kapabacteria bacterium]|nr:GWxTD domain-containing protein [Candidatus Kapabacteria bacterium]